MCNKLLLCVTYLLLPSFALAQQPKPVQETCFGWRNQQPRTDPQLVALLQQLVTNSNQNSSVLQQNTATLQQILVLLQGMQHNLLAAPVTPKQEQPTPVVHYWIQNGGVQPSPTPPFSVQPSPTPPFVVQPSPNPPFVVQPSPTPPVVVQPSPTTPIVIQPAPTPPINVQPSPVSPINPVAPSPSAPVAPQPSPAPPTTTPVAPNPSPAPVTPVKPSGFQRFTSDRVFTNADWRPAKR